MLDLTSLDNPMFHAIAGNRFGTPGMARGLARKKTNKRLFQQVFPAKLIRAWHLFGWHNVISNQLTL